MALRLLPLKSAKRHNSRALTIVRLTHGKIGHTQADLHTPLGKKSMVAYSNGVRVLAARSFDRTDARLGAVAVHLRAFLDSPLLSVIRPFLQPGNLFRYGRSNR